MSSAPPSVAAPLSSGALFHGRYRIVRALKAGGMGAVYEVVDQNTDAPRALKVMLPSVVADAEQRARFALEARVTGSIESDHLVRVSDSGVDEGSGSPFLVMELLRGEELGDLLARQRRLPPAEVLTYLTQASLALDKTHAAGVVHRDIKPDNLLVTRRDDGSPCVKILDFGIAKLVVRDQQKTRALGTPLYMSPEQIKGEGAIGPRADLYSLAEVAYTLLAGEPYWAEDAAADDSLYGLLMKVMAGAREPASARALRRTGTSLPPAFDPWFFKATAADPAARFDRATTQTAALAEVFAAASRAAPPGTAAIPTPMAPTTPAVPYDTGSMASVPSTQPSAGVAKRASSVASPAAPYPGPGAPALTPAQSPVMRAPPPVTVVDPPRPPTQPVAVAAASAHPGPGPATPPTAPGAPQRSRGLLIAIAIVGGVMAVGLVLIGVALLGGGGGGSSEAGSWKPIPNCMPGATCLAAELPDPAHVDPQAILPMVTKIARNAEGHAVLSTIFAGETGKDGTTDLGADKQMLFQFSYPGGTVSITLRKKMAIVMKTQPLPYSKSSPEPQCSARTAFKTAIAAGFAALPTSNAMYSSNDLWPGGVWTLTAGKQSFILDGKTCAIKTSNKL